jgi:hypothetical protein
LVFVFIVLHFHSSFSTLFYSYFLAHVVSSLAYPNLLGTKRLGCCCCIRDQVMLVPSMNQ